MIWRRENHTYFIAVLIYAHSLAAAFIMSTMNTLWQNGHAPYFFWSHPALTYSVSVESALLPPRPSSLFLDEKPLLLLLVDETGEELRSLR